MKTNLFSPNKIIIYVAITSALLIAALFASHWQQPKPTLKEEQGMMFSVARDIKPFKLTANNNVILSEKDFRNHWTLLFFGFTHCSQICPTTLGLLNRVYPTLKVNYPALQVAFISLDPERDTPKIISDYTHSFNTNFLSATGKTDELRKLQSQLGIYSGKDNSLPGNNYQIQHTTSILLINPDGKWVGFFRFGLNPEQFMQAFRSSVSA